MKIIIWHTKKYFQIEICLFIFNENLIDFCMFCFNFHFFWSIYIFKDKLHKQFPLNLNMSASLFIMKNNIKSIQHCLYFMSSSKNLRKTNGFWMIKISNIQFTHCLYLEIKFVFSFLLNDLINYIYDMKNLLLHKIFSIINYTVNKEIL